MKQLNPQTPPPPEPRGRRLAFLALAALGVVYGDIGTSPLYAIRECFQVEHGIAPSPENIIGVLSLIFWSLILVVTLKYISFILRADNKGEGGVMALTSLIGTSKARRHKRTFLLMGLFAAALLYGDGIITPAISVLSAVEGIEIITPVFQPYIVPLTVIILVGLFVIQRKGTGGVGTLFGPVTLVWFATISALGIRSLIHQPSVLVAVNPWYGLEFFIRNGLAGFLILGAVVLVVTGAEALYADMGHFGPKPIRITWTFLVLPALLLNYFGQGALLVVHPEAAHHPFYSMVPESLLIPMVFLATLATIIASQAVISGAFSLTWQAIQLGYLPRLQIVHTSATERGQIYIPQVNWILMVATVALVLGFRTSTNLAAAYGVAVTGTMLSTTILFYVVARDRLGWSRRRLVLPVILFLMVDIAFFTATMSKVAHGGWFPLVAAAAVFSIFTAWKAGRALMSTLLYAECPTLDEFLRQMEVYPPHRVPGKAVFMAGKANFAPPAMVYNIRHNKVLHETNVIITVETQDTPRVPREEKVTVENLGQGFYRVIARYGYMEQPNVPHLLALARDHGLELELEEPSFFLGRETLVPHRRSMLPVWRRKIFTFLSRNSLNATTFFAIPSEQVVEIGTQIEI